MRLDWQCSRKNRLGFLLDIPVLAMVSRPPTQRLFNNDLPNFGYVLDNMHSNIEFATLGKMLSFNAGIFYEFNLLPSQNFRQRLSYSLSYLRLQTSGDFRMLTHNINLTLARWL